MVVKIFTGPFNYDIEVLYTKEDNEYLIGVDRGAIIALEARIDIDLAIGDFDSVTAKQLQLLEKQTKKVEKFESEKDYTDTFLALKKAFELNPDEIVIYGGLGGRIDHSIANMNLLKLGRISLVDENTKMYMIDPGTYEIENEYKYISFFAIEDVFNLTLTGFKYEIDNTFLDVDNPLCISNEGSGRVLFKEGLILVIHQNE